MTQPDSNPPVHYVDVFKGRVTALALAVEHYDAKTVLHQAQRGSVLDLAQEFWLWLLDDAVGFIVSVGIPYEQDSENPYPQYERFLQGENMAEAVTLTDSQQVTVGVQPVDKKGYPVTDELTWTSADESIASLMVAADNYSAVIVAGAPGSTSVTVADANGLSDVIAVSVTAGTASGLTATVGTPEEQPASTSTGSTSGTVTTSPPPASTGGSGDTAGTTTAADGGSGSAATPATGSGDSPTTDSTSNASNASDSGSTVGQPTDGSGGPVGGPPTAPGPGADTGGITPPAQVS